MKNIDALGKPFDGASIRRTEPEEAVAYPRQRRVARYITPRSQVPGVYIKECIGFSGPSRIARPTNINQWVKVMGANRIQYISNARTLVYKGRALVADIPSGQFVEVMARDAGEVKPIFYIRHYFDYTTLLNNHDVPYPVEFNIFPPNTTVGAGTALRSAPFIANTNFAAERVNVFLTTHNPALGGGSFQGGLDAELFTFPGVYYRIYGFNGMALTNWSTLNTPFVTRPRDHYGLMTVEFASDIIEDWVIDHCVMQCPPGSINLPQENQPLLGLPLPGVAIGSAATRIYSDGSEPVLEPNPGIG